MKLTFIQRAPSAAEEKLIRVALENTSQQHLRSLLPRVQVAETSEHQQAFIMELLPKDAFGGDQKE